MKYRLCRSMKVCDQIKVAILILLRHWLSIWIHPTLQQPPKQKITDPDELQEYRLRKRKEFEDNIRKNRSSIGNWIKYTKWEESQHEIAR